MMQPGAHYSSGSVTFTVWAPLKKAMAVHLYTPEDRVLPMRRGNDGYWTVTAGSIPPGALYKYRIDNGPDERPDPASYCQPEGVHGPSMVIDHTGFGWSNEPSRQPPLDEYILYELHTGTFTDEGTFAAATARLPHLVDLGITAVEIMPVAQFPGKRNWGYDGVYPFAVQFSYGGVDGLKRFIDACHRHDLAVLLDVVYNHLGPEGNYLRDFGPYFTVKYSTPWGESINFDDAWSDGVVDFFIANACYWLREFRIDALRLDAVHAICDRGARPFLQRLSETVEKEFPAAPLPKYLIAESDLNDVRILNDRRQGGFGLHAQWSDDFHHAVHTLLTGEKRGYYIDFGTLDHLTDALKMAFCYNGRYSGFRRRSHGNDASSFATGRFVVCSQNHDQIGNRFLGERLITLTDTPRARLAAALTLLSPYVPLLFMGEEHGETNPFLYFADHTDEPLRQAVREGRRTEFAAFDPDGTAPDPFDRTTFDRSKPDWNLRNKPDGAAMLRLYTTLIAIRRENPAIGPGPRANLTVERYSSGGAIGLHYHPHPGNAALCLFNFGDTPNELSPGIEGQWKQLIDSCRIPDEEPEETVEAIHSFPKQLRLSPFGFAVFARVS
ncbi:MAG: malto-oligosyltrehalose trehalohydrolase [Chitinispirillaceae bacterium]|nr:malto-oligosyltrehalose trehalohydrolase [Chitinispirillaceae bacterium]